MNQITQVCLHLNCSHKGRPQPIKNFVNCRGKHCKLCKSCRDKALKTYYKEINPSELLKLLSRPYVKELMKNVGILSSYSITTWDELDIPCLEADRLLDQHRSISNAG